MGQSHLVRIFGSHAIVMFMEETIADRNAEAPKTFEELQQGMMDYIMFVVNDEEESHRGHFHKEKDAMLSYCIYLKAVIFKCLETLRDAGLVEEIKDYIDE